MTPVTLREGGGWKPAPGVSRQTLDRLKKLEITEARTSRGTTELRAKRKVGSIRFPDLELHIEPKLAISRLAFLLGFAYARLEDKWREPDVSTVEDTGLLPLVSYTFLRAVDQALVHGLPSAYRPVSRTSPVIRGRIREADQLRKHGGHLYPAEVTYHQLTSDTGETAVLRAAAEHLLTVPCQDAEAERRLHDLLARIRLAVPHPSVHATWSPTPDNLPYRTALGLADLVLRDGSFEYVACGVGSIAASGLIIDMDKVLEDFLENALRPLLTKHGGQVKAQETFPLDTGGAIEIHPDVRWFEGDTTLAVIDAKYTSAKPVAHYRYQMLAYCGRLSCAQGHIVYAGGKTTARREFRIHMPPMLLAEHTLDLAAPVADIKQQITNIADRIVTLASRSELP
ncbi:McrC family protein [Nonomuraea soli]|uniref:5-methylcytosine-specific restriction enzyme subunit McrC n=1 Tax=Nonomuraea soli TaxID=1032476 RepID=A0A7W0HPC1_9ACTN|nr:hypothetical protein [Nonomuraea soli]MBA2890426.1 5-methylcytosine-specific restriction enzyme subunit McrC [Nonomuraea soli]